MADSPVKLDRRLMAAASLVRPGTVVSDVGCDHGKLTAWLILSKRARKVIASDINEQPLEKTKKLVSDLGIGDKAEIILADGIPTDEADDIVMAGIGPDVILSCIDRAPFIKDSSKNIVLIPASHPERLREGLMKRGFTIAKDLGLEVSGKYYSVMSCSYSGDMRTPDPAFCELGLIDPSEEDGLEYMQHIRKKHENILKNIKRSSTSADALKIEISEEIIRAIDERLNCND